MKFADLFIVAAALTIIAEGRQWKMCELARTMDNHGFPRHQLDDWMCLVSHESGYEQTARNPDNVDGSTDWGLFQINDRYWCKNTEKYNPDDKNVCQMTCQSFLSGGITNNLNCVERVFQEHGFGGWVAWKRHCKNQELPDTRPCFERSNKTTSSSKYSSAYDRSEIAHGVNAFWK